MVLSYKSLFVSILVITFTFTIFAHDISQQNGIAITMTPLVSQYHVWKHYDYRRYCPPPNAAKTPTLITLPVPNRYANGKVAHFIATDASTKDIVSSISNTKGFQVNYAPLLANTTESSRRQGSVFVNGNDH